MKTKGELVVDAIAAAPNGLTFREVQKVAFNLAHPGEPFTAAQRGWWCDYLLHTWWRGAGLLHRYAYKDGAGRYRRNAVAFVGAPCTGLR